jgi:PAS domain S-box-containing protein
MKAKVKEEQSRKLFDQSPSPMFAYDLETTQFLAVNDAALAQYGYTRQEFLSMNARQIRPKEDLEAFEKSINVPATYADSGRWRHTRKGGEVFFVHIHAHTTTFGNKTARLISAIDIDNSVKAEMALAKKSDEVQHILQSITDAFFAIDFQWRFTFVNRACEQMFKLPKDELIGKSIWGIFSQNSDLKFFRELNEAMNSQVSVLFEEYDPVSDMWVGLRAYPTHEGIACYAVDITELKKARDKADRDDQNLLAIINNTKDMIWSVDRDSKVITANHAFWERVKLITGKGDKDIGRDSFDNDLFEKWRGFFRRAFEGEAFKVVLREIMPTGEEAFDEISFNPVYDKNSKVTGVSCFSRDITDQELYTRKIEQQNETLNQIAWIQSHEVRRPVANILGLTELFDRDDNDPIYNLAILDKIKDETKDLDVIIRKIGSYANKIQV